MKTVTVREFYHNAGLMDGLADGKQLLVTVSGKPKFVLIRSERPKMTRQLAEARAVGGRARRTFDGTSFLSRLKK